MTLTPVEIRHLKPDRSLVGGYKRTAVDALMDVSAEKSAVSLREQAGREADLIVAEARSEARAITRAARADHDRLLTEVRRMRTLLHSALALVDEAPPGKAAEAEAA